MTIVTRDIRNAQQVVEQAIPALRRKYPVKPKT